MTCRGNFEQLEHSKELAKEGKVAEALAVCDAILKKEPESAAALDAKGFYLTLLDRLPEALECFRHASRNVPTLAPFRYNLAKALELTGDYREAIREYDEVLGLQPGDAEAWLGRGSVHLRLEELDDAVADLDQAVRLAPEDPECLIVRGVCRFGRVAALGRGELDAAIADFEAASALAPAEKPRIAELLHGFGREMKEAGGADPATMAQCDAAAARFTAR